MKSNSASGKTSVSGDLRKNYKILKKQKAACSLLNRRHEMIYIIKGKKKQAYYFSVICLLVVLDKDFDSHVIPLVFPQVLTD